MENRTILALDQATITSGYSIYRNGKIKKSGLIKCNAKQHSERYLQFYNQLNEIIGHYNVTDIVAEDIYPGEKIGYLRLGEIRGVLLLVAACKKIPVNFLYPSEHKENLTGNRYANKLETMEYLKEMGYKFADDNVADSISIMLCFLNNQNLPVTYPTTRHHK